MNERPKHIDAFNAYFALGEKRSLEKLHLILTKNPLSMKKAPSLSTLKIWSGAFGWQERVMIRNRDIAQNAEARITKEEEDIRVAVYRKLRKEEEIYTAQEVTAFYTDETGKTRLKAECTPKSSTELTRVQEGKRKNLESQIKILAPEEGKADLGEIHIIFEDIETNDRKTRKKIKEVSNVSE